MSSNMSIHSFLPGPYMFLLGFGTYLSSKEIYVYEHEFYCGLALFRTCKQLEDQFFRPLLDPKITVGRIHNLIQKMA